MSGPGRSARDERRWRGACRQRPGARRRRPVAWLTRCGIRLVLLGCVVMAGATSLVSPQTTQAQARREQSDALAGTVRSFEDVLGHQVRWSEPPSRIVSLSPSITEILFSIGCDTNSIVGVTRFCTYPPQAAVIPQVGGVVDPSLEVVLAREPDLVLATRGNPLEFMASLVSLGLPVYALETRGDLGQIIETIRAAGSVSGRDDGARALIRRLHEHRDRVERRTVGLDSTHRPRVYYGELEGALWTAGPGSYLNDLIWGAGGANVAAGAPSAWCALSLEEIVAHDPQVYLGSFSGDDTSANRAAETKRIQGFLNSHEVWSRTSLGRDPRIFLVQEDRLMRPGPRIFDVLEEFARFLHPDQWE
ncbi:MAG: ABC transporter substrate-binding protein [Candidatus Eisenbacteria sp.]|nr:ABC transporter substrate-binding protein [Candidatus Eisenbacteria bacterium]